MNYRRFGRLEWKASALGFGAMRLPTIDSDPSQIDEPEATRMIRYAIDHGVNYVDTAYPYHREESERFLGRVLQNGYRERVHLATKMPCWKIEEPADFDRFLDEQLEKLQTSHIDFYLLHGLNESRWAKMRDLGVIGWAERAIAAGCIGHLGFSFHDKYEVFQEIIDATDLWLFCQIQYNFMDVDYQAGTRGLEYAAGKGLAVVIMEPLRGGRLTNNIPPSIQNLWDQAPAQRTPAEWALRWVWNHPEVSVVLSGMSTMEHVVENVAIAASSAPNTLSDQELAVFDLVREKYQELCPIPCTDCQYCLPCPNNVAIPRIFKIYNEAFIYPDDDRAHRFYDWIPEDERANLCVACGECLDKCPQAIQIPDWLEKAHALLCSEEA